MKIKIVLVLVLLSGILKAQNTFDPSHFVPTQIEYANSYNWENDELVIDAKANTNLFVTHNKKLNVTNVPMLLKEVEGDFEFHAKVKPQLRKKWDAGVLMVYVNDNFWGKLCFEKTVEGPNRIISVVNNFVSDDAKSDIIHSDSVYLRIVKKDKSFRFAYSLTGLKWTTVRYFTLNEMEDLKIGFSSQSPAGLSCESKFSEMKLAEIKTDK